MVVGGRSARRVAASVAVAVAVGLVPVLLAPRPAAAQTCRPQPTAPLPQRPWSQQRLAAERVWPVSTGAGVVVAVVDTGVDAGHPQLTGHVLAGYDVAHGGPADSDCQGHGTFVAGIIAAQPVAGIAFAGVAPGAVILPVREADSAAQTPVHTLAAGIRTAADHGARVINVSVVTRSDDPELRAAVQYAIGRGAVVVGAAGNDFASGDPQEFPAAYPGVLAVGAIDATGARSSFSETGAVGVVAPGSDLISTGAGGTGLVAGTGTSFATPFVTGVAALVVAYHPGLRPDQVIHRIEVTADHPAGALPDPQYGWGVVNPYAAVTAVLPEEGTRPVTTIGPSPVAAAAADPSGGARGALSVALALAALAMVGLSLLARLVLARGRLRRWRPGAGPTSGQPDRGPS